MDLEGFVVSDKTRRAVVIEVMAGETDFDHLVKKHRLIKPAADRALKELIEHDLLKRGDDGALALTATGEEVARDLKRQETLL